jgi:hypothetical protein
MEYSAVEATLSSLQIHRLAKIVDIATAPLILVVYVYISHYIVQEKDHSKT